MPLWQQAAAILAGPGTLTILALAASTDGVADPEHWLAMLLSPQVGPYLVWLALLPAVALWEFVRPKPSTAEHVRTAPGLVGRAVLFLSTSLAAFAVTAYFGASTRDLPPAYHDEYSYLFQTETFLAGRLGWPAPDSPQHFQQVHILIDNGVFASRYFPGTGLWLAPFVAIGMPFLAGWVAQALIAGFTALAAGRCSLATGLLAGILVATSPGMVIFSNTLLSPHPTMLGLVIAWWALSGMQYRGSTLLAVVSGLVVGFAFLTRPVTAAAIGLPWAIYGLNWFLPWASERSKSFRRYALVTLVAFLPAVAAMGAFNRSLTGSVFETPYGNYTAIYTPSHVYGFWNRTRGLEQQGDRTEVAYDDWAEELTPKRAVELVGERWWNATGWMIGLVPLFALGTIAVFQVRALGDRVLLPLLSIVSLTLAYFPFAFTGIFGWSYLVEATPFVLLVAAFATARLWRTWWDRGRVIVAVWFLGLVAIPVMLNLTVYLPEAFSPSSEFVAPRLAMAERFSWEENLAKTKPVLILYDLDPRSDLHSTWVFNNPKLRGPVVRAWAGDNTREVMDLFPDRDVYLCRVVPGQPPQYKRLR